MSDTPSGTQETPYPSALERFPKLRQSRLSSFDQCALMTRFDEDMRSGWSGHPQGRGQIFHRFAAKALLAMAAAEEKQIDEEVALSILRECLRQHDVPDEEVVNIPFEQIKDLRWVVVKWAADNEFDIEYLAAIEQRIDAVVQYPHPDGGWVDRIVTGALDALFIPEPGWAVVIDWKDAQPLHSKILTPSGWTTMGELSVGQQVIGSDGKPTKVTGVYPKGERLVYEVEFTDGSKTECCGDHWWTVRRSGRDWQTKRLREIIGDEKKGHGYWQVAAPEPVEFDRQGEQPLDPYLLGVLLGDGHFASEGSVDLATADAEIIEAVQETLPDGMTARHTQRYNWRLAADSRATRNPLRRAITDLGLMECRAASKFIPPAYLFGSPEERFDMLCGLMDTDGSIDKEGRMSFCSASSELAKQVQFLVRSLGGFATFKTWPRAGHYHDTNAVYFRLDRAPFRLGRKKSRWHKPKQGMARGIRKITPLTVQPVQCIKVAAKDSLYVTDDLILTHNSWALPPQKSLSAEGYFQQRCYAALVMSKYPSIERVTLREHYVRYSESREATVFRSQLPDILEELAALCERWDRTWEHGKWPLEDGEDPVLFTPSPGAHCIWCPGSGKCPIYPSARTAGAITDEETAERWAGEQIVAKAVVKQREASLKAWAGSRGPIPVQHAKDPNRVLGYRESTRTSRPTKEALETALAEQGADLDPATLFTETKTSRFDTHSRKDSADMPEDASLMNALEQSLKEQNGQ